MSTPLKLPENFVRAVAVLILIESHCICINRRNLNKPATQSSTSNGGIAWWMAITILTLETRAVLRRKLVAHHGKSVTTTTRADDYWRVVNMFSLTQFNLCLGYVCA